MFQFVQDWQQVKKIKRDILAHLKRTRPGAGVTLKAGPDGRGGLSDPLVARAVQEILKDNPNVFEATDMGFSVTIMRKIDQHKSMTAAEYDKTRHAGGILGADNLSTFCPSGHELPPHQFRDGVPLDFNGPVEVGSGLVDPSGRPIASKE